MGDRAPRRGAALLTFEALQERNRQRREDHERSERAHEALREHWARKERLLAQRDDAARARHQAFLVQREEERARRDGGQGAARRVLPHEYAAMHAERARAHAAEAGTERRRQRRAAASRARGADVLIDTLCTSLSNANVADMIVERWMESKHRRDESGLDVFHRVVRHIMLAPIDIRINLRGILHIFRSIDSGNTSAAAPAPSMHIRLWSDRASHTSVHPVHKSQAGAIVLSNHNVPVARSIRTFRQRATPAEMLKRFVHTHHSDDDDDDDDEDDQGDSIQGGYSRDTSSCSSSPHPSPRHHEQQQQQETSHGYYQQTYDYDASPLPEACVNIFRCILASPGLRMFRRGTTAMFAVTPTASTTLEDFAHNDAFERHFDRVSLLHATIRYCLLESLAVERFPLALQICRDALSLQCQCAHAELMHHAIHCRNATGVVCDEDMTYYRTLLHRCETLCTLLDNLSNGSSTAIAASLGLTLLGRRVRRIARADQLQQRM